MHLVVWMQRIVTAIFGSECVNWPKLLNKSASIHIIRVTQRDRAGGEQKALTKKSVSLRGVYVWGVKSTVTKQSDYFVWKDTSERMNRRCDDTCWQDASEFLCIQTPLLFEGGQLPKNPHKTPWNTLSDALLISHFQISSWRRKQKVFWNRASRGFC